MTETIRIATQLDSGARRSVQLKNVLADLQALGSWESMALRSTARSQPQHRESAGGFGVAAQLFAA